MNRYPHRPWLQSLLIVLATACGTTLAAANARVSLPSLAGAAAVSSLATGNAAPARAGVLRADAGDARSASIGQIITLDGAGSNNLDGNRLSYSWTLRAPDGSGASLSDPAAVRPQFTVDLLGDYIAELVVADGEQRSEPAAVRVSTGNVAPVARAGSARHVDVGETVLLDAAGSFDFNGDSLSYRWSLDEAPAGSRAPVQNGRASIAAFTPDRPGEYWLSLVANDGRADSARATIQLSTVDARPVAAAGADRRVTAGASVRLDGRESADPEGKPLGYRWSLLHAPAHSNARLAGATTARPTLQTDAAGIYIAQLLVSDGVFQDAADIVVVEAAEPVIQFGPAPMRGEAQDVDGDGIPDALDNCPDYANPTQLDTNGDGFGNRCDPDLDNDGFITNFGDLGLLKQALFSNPGSPNWNPDADFNEDNSVNFVDLGIMKEFFFGPPGPLVITFTNPAGGDWHDPGNWAPPVVPTTIHTVRIDLDPGVVVEYSAGLSEISGLRASSPVLISGGELSITKEAQFNGGLTIQGGATLANANILAPTVIPAPAIEIPEFSTATFDGVALGADLNLQRGSTVTVENGLLLDNATVTLISDNNFTSMTFSGANGATSTLGGAGEVLFSGTATLDNRNRVLVSGTGHALTVAPGVTIRSDTTGGEVRHNNAGPVSLQGAVISNLATRVITLVGAPLNVEGELQVSNGGRIQANFGGTGSTIDASALLTVNTGELELFGDFTNEGTIAVTDGTLDIGNVVGDEWDNDGLITLTNSTVEAGGSFTAASVGTLTGTGTSIINGVLDNTGQTLDLGTVLPGTVQLGTGGSIVAGTIATTPVTLLEFQTFTLDGVTLSTGLDLERGATMTVTNGLTLDNATVTLISDNNFTSLTFTGANGATSTLGGTGEVLFSGTATLDNRNRILVSGTGHALTVAPDVTIRTDTTGGEVRHNNAGPVNLQGTVISNLATRVITLVGAPLIVEGELQVSNDGRIQANFGGIGSSIAASALLTVNTGELELFGDFTNEGTITITDGTLDIGNVVGDEWDNNGTITLDNATVELGGSFVADNVGNLSGSGTVTLNGTLDNAGQTLDLAGLLPGTVQLGTGGTIVGGVVAGTTLTLPEFMTFTLDGVMLDVDLMIERGSTMTITNGLTLDNATVTLISDNNFTSLTFTGANGATSTLGGTGEVLFSGTATLDNRNRVLVSGTGHALTVAPAVTIRTDTTGGEVRHNNAGPVNLQETVISSLATRVITLVGSPLNVEGELQVSNGGRIQANFGGSGSTIPASALLTVNTGELELFGDFTNEGTITITDGTLDIGNVVGDEWDNDGTITLTNSTVEAGGSFTVANIGSVTGTGMSIINGVLDNTGQTLDLGTVLPGTVQLGTGGSIVAGTIATTPVTLLEFQTFTLDGVTLSTGLDLERGATMTITNGLTLDNATVTLISDNNFTSLTFTGANGDTSTLGGPGEVLFNGTATLDNRNRVLVSGTGHALTVAPDVTIRSDTTGGEVRHNNTGPVNLQGPVISNLATRVITLVGSPLIVEGELQVSNGGRIQANFGGTGSTIAASALLTVNTGELELFDDFTNEGTITITDGTLDIGNVVGDEWNNSGTITLSNATVELGGTFTAANIGSVTGTGMSTVNGTLDNTGQTLDLGSLLPGTVQLGTGGSIVAGTIATTPLTLLEFQTFTLDGVTLSTDLDLERGANMTIANGLTLDNSTVTMISDNNFTSLSVSGTNGATSTLGGTGEILFSGTATLDNRNRILVSGTGHILSVAAGVTIRSDTTGGELRHNSNGPVTLQGPVISDVSARTLTLVGVPLTVEGNLSVGAGSTMDLNEYTLASSAELDVAVGGTATSDFGRYLGDAAQLAGTLDISLVNGFSPSLSETFGIMSFTSRSGTFDTESGTGLGGGLSFQVNYNPTDVTLEVVN